MSEYTCMCAVCRHTCVFSHQVMMVQPVSAPLKQPWSLSSLCATTSKSHWTWLGQAEWDVDIGRGAYLEQPLLSSGLVPHDSPQGGWPQPRSHQGQSSLKLKPLGFFPENARVRLEEGVFPLSEAKTKVLGDGGGCRRRCLK